MKETMKDITKDVKDLADEYYKQKAILQVKQWREEASKLNSIMNYSDGWYNLNVASLQKEVLHAKIEAFVKFFNLTEEDL